MLDHRLIEALHESVLDDKAFDRVLALLAERFRCPSAALIYVDSTAHGASVAVGYGLLDEEAQRRYRELYAQDDPAPAAMARLKVGQATTTGRLFDADASRHRRFIEEFYYPLGLREALGGPVINTKGRHGVLAVQRGDDRGAFNDEDIDRFLQIVPHVATVLRLRRRFFELEASVGGLESALDDVAVAAMVFDRRGRLRHANIWARTLIDRRDGLTLDRNGRLGAKDSAANQELGLVFARGATEQPALVRVPRPDGLIPYIVKVTSAATPGQEKTVKICDPSRSKSDIASLLAFALQMPLSSAQVTAALLSGESLAALAGRTATSLNTLKFRLKGAFAASGTSRQADLVRVASNIVRDLG